MKNRLTPRAPAGLQRRLLAWFSAHRRELPWRRSRDPYGIWVAEVMLQQTRIAAVLPYYHRFMRKFPSVQRLARAREAEVLRAWSGLGYYSRARNLHRAAREIVARHEGKFPRSLEVALALPGVGRYTAAAVLSIAYDVRLAVLDGNVARVLARLGAIRGDLRAPRRWRQLGEMAQHLLVYPEERRARRAPGDWNQALMELGETVCTPQAPRCAACPVARWCRAHARGITGTIPAPRRKRDSVHVRVAAAILRDPRGRTLLVREPGLPAEAGISAKAGAQCGALFSRLWQFPAVVVAHDAASELAAHVRSALRINSLELEPLPAARHGVTFRNITLLPFLARVPRLPRRALTRAIPLARLHDLPVSSATRKIAAAAAH